MLIFLEGFIKNLLFSLGFLKATRFLSQGLTKQANERACAAEALYRQGELTSEKIAQQLGISKPTLYKYLKIRSVPIGLRDINQILK